MLIALIYLLNTLLAPAPLVSLVVVPQTQADRLDVVVHFLNSDARYTDYAVTVADITTPIAAPVAKLQVITVTLPLKLPPICHAHVVYELVVTARVLTDTVVIARTDVGGIFVHECPERVYIP